MFWDCRSGRKGLAGIEYQLDSQIRSKSEKNSGDGRPRVSAGSMVAKRSRERGANVVLTLDEKIQYIAQTRTASGHR